MKSSLKIMAIFILATLTFLTTSISEAHAWGYVYVRGYTRTNGTFVRPHYRTTPDGNPYNNLSWYFEDDHKNLTPYNPMTAEREIR